VIDPRFNEHFTHLLAGLHRCFLRWATFSQVMSG
jgi:hypothetical protein